jgi:hypothetical protein
MGHTLEPGTVIRESNPMHSSDSMGP